MLLDLLMPDMGGFEVASRLRQDPELAAIPLVAVTAATVPNTLSTCIVCSTSGREAVQIFGRTGGSNRRAVSGAGAVILLRGAPLRARRSQMYDTRR